MGLVLGIFCLGLVACDSGGSGATEDPVDSEPSSAEVRFADDAPFVVDSTIAVRAIITDADDEPIAGETVTWTVSHGSVNPTTSETNDDGVATTQWRLGTETTGTDAQEVTASVQGVDVEARRAASVNPGPVSSLGISVPKKAIAVDSTVALEAVDLRDAFGNEITDLSSYTFTWASLASDVASVSANAPSSSATVKGLSDGNASIVVSTGGGPDASLASLAKTDGAAADTVEIDVRRHELRGVWLTTTDSQVFNSRQNIEEAMEFLDTYNFNVVFPVVWNQAGTTYPSTVMDTLINRPIKPQFDGRDPLQEIIEEAHERGIAVIPWFEFGFAASYAQDGGPIIDKYPSWAARDQSGDLLEKNGFEWLNPYKPAVQDFMKALILEVVDNYDVDGIQGDDRLPANPVEGGYSDFTKELYRSENGGQDPPTNENDPDWKQWRAGKLSSFGQDVYDAVKGRDEDLIVSWSPSIWRFSYDEYLQDWPSWINGGYTDIMHPQVYRRDISSYKSTLTAQSPSNAGWDPNEIVGFYPGVLLKVGGYVATPEDILEVVQTHRDRGYNGEVYFFYEGLREFDADVAEALKNGPYADPAPLPFQKASNTP